MRLITLRGTPLVLASCALIVFLVSACYPIYEPGMDGRGAPGGPAAQATPTPEPLEPTPTPVATDPQNPDSEMPVPVAQFAPESQSIGNWLRGMSLSPRWEDFFAYSPFKDSVDQIAQTNANYIALITHHEQADRTSTEIHPTWLTPADWVLIEGIQYIHSKCMAVMLKPHIDVANADWQASIEPSDRAEWFRNYGEIILHYARLAEEHDVEMLAVGTELNSMASAAWDPSNTQYWRDLISDVREVYSGKLTYSGQWGPTKWSVDNIEFLDDLDYIGIAAYFNLDAETSAVHEIREAWHRWNERQIRPVYERFKKPIIFTEVGYRNQEGARKEPWANLNTESDEQEQSNLYEATMAYWSEIDYFNGLFWWEWRDDLAPDNTYYTPNDKLAEEVLTTWFGKGVSSPRSAQTCAAPEHGRFSAAF